MDGTEPFLRDAGLMPLGLGLGERDSTSSFYIYRRNSCHQERLQKDLQRLQQQEERSIRRTNREIIDLNLEQKERKEILSRPRRWSECLGVRRRGETLEGVLSHSQGDRFESSSRLLKSRPRSHDSITSNSSSSNTGAKTRFERQGASPLTDSTKSLPAVSQVKSPSSASQPASIDRHRSLSHEHISAQPMATKSTSSFQEKYMDAKTRKEITQLKKTSDRWRHAVRARQPNPATERSGKPPIPTNYFSTAGEHATHKKTSNVFDRLSLETRTSTLPSDKFFQVLRANNKVHESLNKASKERSNDN